MSKLQYPYFETKLWAGRLSAPIEMRGTTIAKLFERGAIGGMKIDQIERFEDTPEDRARLIDWARKHQGDRFDIEYIISPHRSHVALPIHVVFRPEFQTAGVPSSFKR